MAQVIVHLAKAHLSGKNIIIANQKMPLIKLQPFPSARIARRLNGAKRVVRRMNKDFNAPLEDFKDYAR